MILHVVHIRSLRRRFFVGATFLLILVGLAVLLGGCFDHDVPQHEVVTLCSNEDRLSYLQELGWDIRKDAVETLEIQLPEKFEDDWAEYVKLQDEQSFPFSDYAGKNVTRYTYTVENYPDISNGVQINLYLCDQTLIGADLIATGDHGFRDSIFYPDKTE